MQRNSASTLTLLNAVALLMVLCAFAPGVAWALENGLAATPPMGWNSWNAFQLNINEKLIREMADALVYSGMRDAGYEYLIVDAGWKAMNRDAQGRLLADPVKFPSGIKALADYIHSKGLRFGLYTDAGSEDCGSGAPGSKGHEAQDAATFAEWGVDYMKEDWCKSDGLKAREVYTRMSQAIQATGRPMIFSVCEWGDNKPWLWAPGIANLWRTTGDNKDCWDCGADSKDKPGGYPRGWTLILDDQLPLTQYSGPGRWNDPDMLEVGLPGLNTEESKAHFSLWAILAAPLIAGADLRVMSAQAETILENREVIAVDQDPLGRSGTRSAKHGLSEVWSRPLADGYAVVLFNRDTTPQPVNVQWHEIGLLETRSYAVRDLWAHRDLGVLKSGYRATVPAHGVAMIKIKFASQSVADVH